MSEEEKEEKHEKQEEKAKVEEPAVEESKKEPAQKTEKKEPKSKQAGKYKELIKKIEELSVLELSELVHELEERFGVSAQVPITAAPAAAASTEEGAGGETETKSTFNVELASSGEKKINVIKAVREINPDLGLKEAKDLVDSAPKMIKEDVKKEEAEGIKKKIEEAGGQVTLK